jgi:hypothetical protein
MPIGVTRLSELAVAGASIIEVPVVRGKRLFIPRSSHALSLRKFLGSVPHSRGRALYRSLLISNGRKDVAAYYASGGALPIFLDM